MTSTTHTASSSIPGTARRVAFKGLAGLLALTLTLFGGQLLFAGWLSDAHAIHEIGWGVMEGLLMVVPLAVCLVRPQAHPAAMQQLLATGAAMVVTMLLVGAVDAFAVVLALLLGVLAVLHPARREVLRIDAPDWTLASYVAAAAVPLVLYALDRASLQRTVRDAHAALDHYTGLAAASVAILLVACVAAANPRGSRVPAWTAGLGAITLGAASLLFSGQASSFGAAGAVAAVVSGAGFIALAERRR